MDPRTVAVYDDAAAAYCDEWLSQPPPEDLEDLWREFFVAGGRTIDIGSGSGRDADWLDRNGYPCEGLDVSAGLIAEARRRFPRLRLRLGRLPDLDGLPDAGYDNVMCETVIMHLPGPQVPVAVRSLCRILAPGGVLYLSWRVAEGLDVRDAVGRLYSAFPGDPVRHALKGSELVYDREETSASSGRRVHRLIARKPAA